MYLFLILVSVIAAVFARELPLPPSNGLREGKDANTPVPSATPSPPAYMERCGSETDGGDYFRPKPVEEGPPGLARSLEKRCDQPDKNGVISCDVPDGHDNHKLLPIDQLPRCYQFCMYFECCTAALGAGTKAAPYNITELTRYEFCETYHKEVTLWDQYQFQKCCAEECHPYNHVCHESWTIWQFRICGNKLGYGRDHNVPPP